jgi:hypothetical protein
LSDFLARSSGYNQNKSNGLGGRSAFAESTTGARAGAFAFQIQVRRIERLIPLGDPPAGVSRYSTVSLDRNELFAGLCIVGFVNGNVFRVLYEIRSRELGDVLINTANISVIIWAALFVGVIYVLRLPKTAITYLDRTVALGAVLMFLAPVAPLSWLALTGLAIYFLWISQPGSYPHRGGWIILAMTVPIFWSRVVFSLLSDYILAFDAILVSWIVGTERTGNVIEFSDGSGYLWIATGCSSIANVSLAVLCWALFTQVFYREQPLRKAWWAVATSAAVVAINVTRLSLIDLYQQHYNLLHGPVGATVVNWLTFAAIISICAFGVRHHLPARR